MAIKLEMLRCFVAVARSGGLAGAAELLGRTPSAVSMMLKQFEENLGAPLFETERKSKLTALGAFAFDEATRELDQFDQTVASIEAFARSRAGLVRLAVVPSIADTILPQVIGRFLADRPGVRIDVRDTDSAGVLRELERERVDLGLASGDRAGASIAREELFSDSFGVVCRQDHPLASAVSPLAWQALSPYPLVANGLCAQIENRAFQELVRESQLMVRNTTSLLALVRAGAGITVLPRLVLARSPQDLVFRLLTNPEAQRRIHLLRGARAALSPAAEGFSSALRRAVGELAQSLD